jgi:hypothetical protein
MPEFYHSENTLSAGEVRRRFSYDQETGVIRWIVPPTNHVRLLGTVAGTVHDGYRYIGINRGITTAHQLAWLHYYGVWPKTGMVVDHVDGDHLNNSINNLREATLCQNAQNHLAIKLKENGLPKGVTTHNSGKYQAQISVNRKHIYLGLYDTVEECLAVYVKARLKLHDCPALKASI